MKKTLVLVLSLLMVLSVASVASAGLNIVGGQFSLVYDMDFADEKPIEGSTTGTVKGEARINLEGKYSNDNFTGYCYSRFDFNDDSVEGGAPRWYMKKAEMDYIIVDGFTIGLAYDQDDIKIHDEFVYDGKKLKDFYKGVPMISAKYTGDMVKVSNFNTMLTGGLFENLIVAKADFGDAKVRGLFDMFQADAGDDDKVMGFDAIAEASYNFGDFEVGAGVTLGKAADEDADLEFANFRGAAKAYLGSFTLTGRVEMKNNTTDEKFELGKVQAIVGYGNYELETVVEGKKKIEPKLKFKKIAGTNNDIEAKLTWDWDKTEEKFEEKPALNIKHIFKF